MRHRLILGLTAAIGVLVGFGESAAACRAGGEYRVTGPNSAGSIALTETSSDESASSGTALVDLSPKQACPVCQIGSRPLIGEYHATPGSEGCVLIIRVRDPLDPIADRTGSVNGLLAFGGSVIVFNVYDYPGYPVDLNLTLGVRADSILRP